MTATSATPLAGLRVVDLGDRIGSAFAARLLAELGADVVRIEPPVPDLLRTMPPLAPSDAGAVSAVHLFVNAGKRSVALDLDTPAGLDGLRALLAAADIVVDGLGVAASASLGLDEASLAALNPGAILVDVTSFGRDGPYRDFLGDDALLFALGGVVNATGEPGREPLAPYGHIAEYQLGINTAVAALAALYGREERGIVQSVDVGGFEIAATLIENSIPLYAMTGRLRGRAGTGYYTAGGVLDVFPCVDGFITLAAVMEVQWQGICLAIGKPEWLDDPDWFGWANRGRRLDEVKAAIRENFATRTRSELFEVLQSLRVPCTPSASPADILVDPSHAERRYFATVDDPALGRLTVPRTPWLLDGERGPARRAPAPGEHTAEVLAEWRPRPRSTAVAIPTEAVSEDLDSGARNSTGPRGRSQPPTQIPLSPACGGKGPGDRGTWRSDCRRATSETTPITAPPTPTVPGLEVAPEGVLNGVRIVDLSTAWAGPLGTQILADLGAQVIKIESPDYPDVFRMSELASTGHADLFEWGPFFHACSRNKTSVSLDLRGQEGRAVLRDLVAVSDVVLDNFSARVMRNWGLGHEELLRINPRVIAVSEPGFGLSGPYENFVCYGEPLEAIAGLTGLNGYRGEGPMRTGMAMIDAAAAFHAAMLVIAALIERRRTGRARSIEISQFEVGCRLIAEEVLAASLDLEPPERRGNRDPRFAPQGCYPCAGDDAWVMISVRSDAQWTALAALLGDALAADPALATLDGRRRDHDRIDAAIAAWTRGRSRYEAMHACQAAGIAVAAVLNPPDVVTDPHLLARGFIARVDHPVTGTDTIPGPSFHLSRTPLAVRSPAPRFGEHTDPVLRDLLGRSDAEIARLRAAGIVGRLPRIAEGTASTS